MAPAHTREIWEGLQRAGFDRSDGVVAEDVLVQGPIRLGEQGLPALGEWAEWFVRLGRRTDLADNSVDLILIPYPWQRSLPPRRHAAHDRRGRRPATVIA